MGLLCFQCECQFGNKASCEWHHQLFWHIRVHSAGTTYFSENYFKAMFSFCWISVLLISVTFYTYLANIVLWCDLAFKCWHWQSTCCMAVLTDCSICLARSLSVCFVWARNFRTKWRRKTKIVANLPQGHSNWCATFYPKSLILLSQFCLAK